MKRVYSGAAGFGLTVVHPIADGVPRYTKQLGEIGAVEPPQRVADRIDLRLAFDFPHGPINESHSRRRAVCAVRDCYEQSVVPVAAVDLGEKDLGETVQYVVGCSVQIRPAGQVAIGGP